MFYKKLIFIYLLSISLYANDENTDIQQSVSVDSKNIYKQKELFEYSNISINNTLSFYAAKVYMKNFEENHGYSIGLLSHEDESTGTGFGVGYMKSSSEVYSLLDKSPQDLNSNSDDGVLFFMNYKF